jgi:SAM-dependent methyltransferase
MMYDRLAKHYDNLYSKKNYEFECDIIEYIIKNYSVCKVKNIVDIGCGTGNHAVVLSNKGYYVVGTDISRQMLKEAKKKENERCKFISDTFFFIKKNKEKYDLAISMFNVVNHILNLNSLDEFFKKVNNILKVKSLFVFDCWNQNAVVLDNPKVKKDIIVSNGYKYETECQSMYNWNRSSVLMKNTVIINDNETIKYDLDSIVWQNKVYEDLLFKNGFEILEIKKAFNLDEAVEETSYKLMFICKKGRKL